MAEQTEPALAISYDFQPENGLGLVFNAQSPHRATTRCIEAQTTV